MRQDEHKMDQEDAQRRQQHQMRLQQETLRDDCLVDEVPSYHQMRISESKYETPIQKHPQSLIFSAGLTKPSTVQRESQQPSEQISRKRDVKAHAKEDSPQCNTFDLKQSSDARVQARDKLVGRKSLVQKKIQEVRVEGPSVEAACSSEAVSRNLRRRNK